MSSETAYGSRKLRGLTISGVLALGFILTMMAVTSGQAEASARFERCRDVVIQNYTGTDGLFVAHGSCKLARKVARTYLVNDGAAPHQPLGFRCSSFKDYSGVTCRKGRKRVRWHYQGTRGLSMKSLASRRSCGRISGTRIIAFNLKCQRARSIWKGNWPPGWTGGNFDQMGGIAAFYPEAKSDRVVRSFGQRQVNRKKLGSVPLVFGRVPYESHGLRARNSTSGFFASGSL